jgi:hypothetical protein
MASSVTKRPQRSVSKNSNLIKKSVGRNRATGQGKRDYLNMGDSQCNDIRMAATPGTSTTVGDLMGDVVDDLMTRWVRITTMSATIRPNVKVL